MHVVTVGPAWDADLPSEDALLDRYETLTGWAEALVSAGAERVTVVQRYERESVRERGGVRYRFVADDGAPLPRSIARLRRLAEAVDGERPDVVHFNGLLFPGALSTLRRRLPEETPLLVQHHGGVPPSRFRARLVARLFLRAADGFLFSTPGLAVPWIENGLIAPRQRVWGVLESGTRLVPVEREEARQATGVTGEPALLWVGRLDRNKDPLTVLAGLRDALPSLPGARLTMVFGGNDLLPQVRDLVDSEPTLRGCVDLRGRVPHEDLAAFYSAADLFVLGSHDEGSGYALMEALACGLTPVVTDIPPFRLLTQDGAEGGLFSPGEAGSFARALVQAASAPRDREAVRRRFLESFSWPALGRRALEIYREAITASRSRSSTSRTTASSPSS